MSEMKTVPTDADPHAYLSCVANPGRREDAIRIAGLMEAASGEPPVLWGDSIVGFGLYRYRRRDGSEHRFFRTGLAPRKAALTVYVMPGVANYPDHLAKLGPHKHSVSCLYLGRLTKIDMDVLEGLIRDSLADMARMYPD